MILPVCKPSIVSYLHHANSLCIVETDPRARDLLVNNFLQLYCGAGHEGNIDFYSGDGMYPRYPLIHRAWLSARTLAAMGDDVVRQACGMLDSGCYLDALLDEYHLSAHLAYRRCHFPHQNLIYGYSQQRREFLAMGFDRQACYSQLAIPFDEFRAALASDLGLSVVSRTDLLEYNNSSTFAPLLIQTALRDFLASSNSFLSFRPPQGIFGVATYAVAASLVERNNGAAIDIRPWCVFYEHKEKLLALHDYLVRQRQCAIPAGVGAELTQLRDDFLALRNYLLDAAVSGAHVKPASLRSNLASITASESYAINALIDAAGAAGAAAADSEVRHAA